jgi:hypothetical protein
MSKRLLNLITLSVAVFSEIVANQSVSAMEAKSLTDFDLKWFDAKRKSVPESTLDNFELKFEFGLMVKSIGFLKKYGRDRYDINSNIKKHLTSICRNFWWDYREFQDEVRSKTKNRKWYYKRDYKQFQSEIMPQNWSKANYKKWFFSEHSKYYYQKDYSGPEKKLKKTLKKDSKLCFNLIADAFNDLLKTTLSHNVLAQTNEFLKKEPHLLINLYRDLLKFRDDQYEMAHRTFMTPLISPAKYGLTYKLPAHAITCDENNIEISLNKRKIRFTNLTDDTFEDSELESNDATESILFTHYSEDSNQDTTSTTDLKNSTIKTETTTESSSTLTQSSSSNSQESFNNTKISMSQKLISSHFTFSFEGLEHLQCNCGECNNALNTEVSTSEEKRSYGDRQVFALSRMLLQAEESVNNDMSAPKSLLHNNGECNNVLNTEASSEENSSVGGTGIFFRCNSIIYPEERLKKGSVKKLPLKGSNQKSEEVN